jgi:hypothetical protein
MDMDHKDIMDNVIIAIGIAVLVAAVAGWL